MSAEPSPWLESPPLESAAGQALAETLAIPGRLERVSQLSTLLGKLGPSSIDDMMAVYAAAFVELGDVEYVLLAEWHAGHDPEAAFQWALLTWRGGGPAVMAATVREWAKRDPLAARDAVETIAMRDTRQATRDGLIRGWYESGEPGLVEYIQGLAPGPDRQLAIAQLTRRMVRRHGPDETIRWAESLPDSDAQFKLNVYRRVASALVALDIERAAAFSERIGEGDFGKGVHRRVAVRWAERDPRAAMAWLETLPASHSRDAAVQETYRVWLGSNREAARQFVAERGVISWLESAAVLYVNTLAQQDPEAALAWIPRFASPERQREVTINIGRIWWRADPETASAWMERADLPAEVRRWIETPRQVPRVRDPVG